MEFSNYQLGLFDFIEKGKGNATLVAVAGSGKTTTGVEAVKRIPHGRSHIFLAFNKAIATELTSRGINGRTFHSLCFGAVLRHKGAPNAEPNKLRLLVNEMLGKRDADLYGSFIIRLVGLARNAGIGCLCQNIEPVWTALAEYHDLELDSDEASMSTAIEYAQKLLEWSNASPMVDFDDMLYIAVRDGLSLPKFDFVFVDEAQDTNAIQRAILRKILKPSARLIAIGDPAQAIYGFRGADSDSMQMIADEFDCKRLPLTVSYRCPTSVIEYAQQWVSYIEPAPGAVEGSVENLGQRWSPQMFKADDLIVCRTTKPLIALCYQLLRQRIPARMMGRDIGVGLKSLVNRMKARGVDALVEKLRVYTLREVEKCVAKGQDAKANAIQDKTDAVMVLIDGLPETERTVPALLLVIDSLFSGVEGVTLATIHKAKGLEADRVWWLNASSCPAQWAKKPWQQQQEKNLCYVAATRAKSGLIMIEEQAREREAR